MLIPRMKALIDKHYPGTKLAINEWNFGGEHDNSGGLAVAEALGIFGREDLDIATYWTAPPRGTPASAAFKLFRAPGARFGDRSLPVESADPNRLGVYAATDPAGRVTVVIVNKSRDRDLALELANLPAGATRVRRFGGALNGEVANDPPAIITDQVVLVPAYSAVYLRVVPGAQILDPTDPNGGVVPPPWEAVPPAPEESVGCASSGHRPHGNTGFGVFMLVAALFLTWRIVLERLQ